MLTAGDEYPIHQTPEPVAFSGSDRNFYDRYFFNGYSRDGSVFFGGAFGVYPHLNIMDGAFSILKDGKQRSLHLSRALNMERMDTQVGPMKIEVLEPLKKVRITIEETEGIGATLEFTGRAFPIEEPRFTRRQGPRMLMDVTRMTQNGRWSGELRVDGEVIKVDSRDFFGTRDRSWGVRPIGAADAQPLIPAMEFQFYWIWTPLNFEDRAVYFHVNDDALGKSWNTKAMHVMDGSSADELEHMSACAIDVNYKSGTRRASGAVLRMKDQAGRDYQVDITPHHHFQMKGIGYTHPEWGHGSYHGEEVNYVREEYKPADLNWMEPSNAHIQAISKVVLTDPDGKTHNGFGAFEQLFMGPHEPSGFKDVLDPAK